jgi:hypothetical protein
MLITVAVRMLFHFIKYKHLDTAASQKSQVLIVGSQSECQRVKEILLNYPSRFKLLGFIKPFKNEEQGEWMGSIDNLPLLTELYKANEIIFCAADVSSADIMSIMGNAGKSGAKYKIMPEKGAYIIGSNSKNTTGEFYSVDITLALSNPEILNKKRWMDIIISIALIPLLPLLTLKWQFFKVVTKHFVHCLKGNSTWVGYNNRVDTSNLPQLKPAVFMVGQMVSNSVSDPQLLQNLNYMYAASYQWQNDLDILAKAFFSNNFATSK